MSNRKEEPPDRQGLEEYNFPTKTLSRAKVNEHVAAVVIIKVLKASYRLVSLTQPKS